MKNTTIDKKLDEEFYILKIKFIHLINERLGIVIQNHQSDDLKKAIEEACRNFHCTPSEYYSMLINANDQSPILDHLISGITVGETYFFRDQEQMELLRKDILPKIIQEKRESGSLSLRVWSAGCASGEEIYTIAILLAELLPDIDKWIIKLLATDINTRVLQKGIEGCYSEWSMRSISEYYKKNYFTVKEKKYLISKKIRDLVTFDYLNLNDSIYPSIFNGTNSQDLILCRNVLIYFDNNRCDILMNQFNASLVLGGYLLLGASDPVHIKGTDFVLSPGKTSLLIRPKVQPELIHLIEKPTQPTPIKKLAPISRPEKNKIINTTPKPCADQTSLCEQAIEYANKGRLDKAIKLCEESFKSDSTNELNYFTYALILLELNRYSEAETALRKLLFLDNQFAVGHYQLGLLLIKQNQYKLGIKYLKNALSISESKDPMESVMGSPGLHYNKLAEVLRNEMALYLKAEANYEHK